MTPSDEQRDEQRRATAVLVPAAGRGERLGQGSKAFLPLAGRSILRTALEPFERENFPLYVAAPPERLEEAKDHVPEGATILPGGSSRQATVYALLNACDAEVVLIHDAARPFLPRSVLLAVLEAAWETGAATVARPVADSLLEAESGKALPREGLRAVQTPQGFRRSLILAAHERAREAGATATDDAGLVRRLGHVVKLVEGSSWLFKITTEDDYRMARLLASSWNL